jgi:hypothetical protein
LPMLAVPSDEVTADYSEAEDWVIVSYEIDADSGLEAVMDPLLDTEMKADEALAEAGLGFMDGNDIGESYDLYFNGFDHEDMWAALEPVLAAAPVKWTRVELRDDLEGDATAELTQ